MERMGRKWEEPKPRTRINLLSTILVFGDGCAFMLLRTVADAPSVMALIHGLESFCRQEGCRDGLYS